MYECCEHCEHPEDEAVNGHPVDCIYCEDEALSVARAACRTKLITGGRDRLHASA